MQVHTLKLTKAAEGNRRSKQTKRRWNWPVLEQELHTFGLNSRHTLGRTSQSIPSGACTVQWDKDNSPIKRRSQAITITRLSCACKRSEWVTTAWPQRLLHSLEESIAQPAIMMNDRCSLFLFLSLWADYKWKVKWVLRSETLDVTFNFAPDDIWLERIYLGVTAQAVKPVILRTGPGLICIKTNTVTRKVHSKTKDQFVQDT